MNIRLKRVKGISPEILEKCTNKGIHTCKDILNLNRLEILDKLDIEIKEIDNLVVIVSEFVAPLRKIKTVLKMSEENELRTNFLKTNIEELDNALNGGIPYGSITECVGASGVGKTQFCLTLTCERGIDENVLYIDTEKTFDIKRIKQIIENRFKFGNKQLERLMKNITHVDVNSLSELKNELKNMQKNVIDNEIGFVIVDSIAFPVRKEFGKDSIWNRQEFLNESASILKNVAELCKIPVIVTNHMTMGTNNVRHDFQGRDYSNRQKRGEKPALGNTWAHCVNTRLLFEMVSYTHESYRRITILKSPISPQISIPYKVGKNGIFIDKNSFENLKKKQKNNISDKMEVDV